MSSTKKDNLNMSISKSKVAPSKESKKYLLISFLNRIIKEAT